MDIIPIQDRYVDPFSDIYSDKVNKRLKILIPSGMSLIRGLDVEIADPPDNKTLRVTKGDFVKDYVFIRFTENTDIDVSSISDGIHAVVIRYHYEKTQPPPVATIYIVNLSEINSDDIILAYFTMSGGSIVDGSIDYTDRTNGDLVDIIRNVIFHDGLEGDLDMNNHKIIHVGNSKDDITDPLDAVNKEYVDYNVADVKVKVDDTDAISGFLENKITKGENIKILKMDADSDINNPTFTPDKDHVMLLSSVDEKISLSSGDSTESYLLDKLETVNPIKSEVVNESGVDKLKVSLNNIINGDYTLNGIVNVSNELGPSNSGQIVATQLDNPVKIKLTGEAIGEATFDGTDDVLIDVTIPKPTCTDCTGGCTGTCTGGCQGSCTGTCENSCTGSCIDSCTGSCSNTCEGTCTANCADSCVDTCTGSCSGTCTGTCTLACADSCISNCTGSCTATCVGTCTNDCTGTCTANCANDCTGGCTGTCTATCADDCIGTCTGTCANDCTGGCTGTCADDCIGTCTATCADDCAGTCTGTCANDCTGGCTGTCANDCTGGCTGTCTATCADDCVGSCTALCSDTCSTSCTGTATT